MSIAGIETEYGIVSVGHDPAHPPDPAELSDRLVRAYHDDTLDTPGWDDASESVSCAYPPGALAPPSITDVGYANRLLTNGARLYVDHAHPEHSGPETSSLLDTVTYDKAGDAIVQAAAERASAAAGYDIRVYKNNTDGKGRSYGCHENYLVSRAVPFADLAAQLTGFLVARSVLIGAGRVGVGQHSERPGFQLSQRADFFEKEVGLETTTNRPLVNTRDEPHADPRLYRRLHVITGDANQMEIATYLKVGSMAAVLGRVEDGWRGAPRLADPVAAFHAISHDATCTVRVPLTDGRRLSALNILACYLDACLATAERPRGDERSRLLATWATTLDELRGDVPVLADRLDWVAKLTLLNGLRERGRLSWEHPVLAAADLQYAALDPARSLYHTLVRAGRVQRLTTDAAVERARTHPPSTTRAYVRGSLLRRFPDAVLTAGWDSVTLRLTGGRIRTVHLADPGAYTAAEYGQAFEDSASVEEFLLRARL